MLSINNRLSHTTIDEFRRSIPCHVNPSLHRSIALLICAALCWSGCTPKGARALLQGKKLIEKAKYVEAIERLTNATAILVTNAQAWNYLGLAHHYAGHPAEAETAYNRALRLDHDLSEAHYNLGCFWLEQNKPDQARTELMAFTLRRGNSLEGLLKLGEAQLAGHDAGAIAAAEKSFQEALRLNSQNPEALNGFGMVRFQQRRNGDAQQLFVNALRQRPDFAPAILNLAILHHTRLQDPQAALQRYRQYIALKPRPENADAVFAIVQQLEQQLKPAPPPASSAAQTIPLAAVKGKADSKSNAAVPAVTNITAATTSANEVTRSATKAAGSPVRPTNIMAQPGGPAALEKQAAEPETNSRFAYKPPAKAASGNRKEAEKLFNQGSDAQKAHRLPEAITAYRTATQLDPGYFEAHYNLGLAAAEAGNTQMALSAYESALAIIPDSLDARYNFGLLLKQAGYTTDAVNELGKLIAKYPNESRGHLALANLYAQQLHDDAQAREHYLKVLDIDPRNSQANEIRQWIAEHPQ